MPTSVEPREAGIPKPPAGDPTRTVSVAEIGAGRMDTPPQGGDAVRLSVPVERTAVTFRTGI